MISRLFAASVLYLAQVGSGQACETSPEDADTLGTIERLTNNDVCRALTTGFGDAHDCTAGHYSKDDLTIDVARIDLDKGFAKIPFVIVAPSSQLSGIVGGQGYESHRFQALLFLGLDCAPKYLILLHEPRYLRGSWNVASDPGNPNWKLFTDGDRIEVLQGKVSGWFIKIFEGENK
ncbi:hypothetical protein NKI86_24170 [Mesorhizobium sp. M0320]|uniref:hypothetical protein n=1 Tax=unclassified Mesorhizobium TaxID=325217 RepID=UPI00333637D2